MTRSKQWSGHTLSLMKEQFRVIEWTATTITTRAEPRAADIHLRISLADESAENISRNGRTGRPVGANPANVTKWVLQ